MKNLKQLRERLRLTQSGLAEQIGTTQQSIARWESGKTEPNLATLRDLAICLHTTVDHLVGRESVIEHQTTDPFARFYGDTSGYWGNIGIRLPHAAHSRWYPISTGVMERLFSALQTMKPDDWISFQTLNNKMVICRLALMQVFTFLDEAEDHIDGDWEVGPADVEGWPIEVYECLERRMVGGHSVCANSEFSEKLIRLTDSLIDEHGLDDKALSEICVETRVIYTNGASINLVCTPERLADAMLQMDLFDASDEIMLHLNDGYGDHSVFVSLDLVSLIELPLIVLKRGLEEMEAEFQGSGGDDE